MLNNCVNIYNCLHLSDVDMSPDVFNPAPYRDNLRVSIVNILYCYFDVSF